MLLVLLVYTLGTFQKAGLRTDLHDKVDAGKGEKSDSYLKCVACYHGVSSGTEIVWYDVNICRLSFERDIEVHAVKFRLSQRYYYTSQFSHRSFLPDLIDHPRM